MSFKYLSCWNCNTRQGVKEKFKGTQASLTTYFVAQELRGIMAQLGFRTLKEMVGQTHKINAAKAINHYKAKGLDLSAILHSQMVIHQ